MSIDVLTAMRHSRETNAAVTGRINYIDPGPEKPFTVYSRTRPGFKTNEIYVPRGVLVRNAWQVEPTLSLDVQGFELARQQSAMWDYSDEEEIERVGRAEAAALVKAATGASRVLVFDHTLRRRAPDALRQPSVRVHVDYTESSAPQRVRDLLGADAEELLARRVAFINVWRPIHHDAADQPLVVCDARSVADGDLIAQDVIYADRRGETYVAAYNPNHRWYYFPSLSVDEALLLKCYDSRTDVARFTPHTSFRDPTTPANAPPRESIEYRAIAFY